MEARMVYPTAPFDTQAQHPNVDVPPAHTGENVESPGKAMTVLSKVKDKAKKLRNRIKKVRGSKKAATDHGDNVNEHGTRDFNDMPVPHDKNFDDDEVESDDDEEDEDFHKSNKNEFKYEQLRSIGALDNQGDGSEVEVHGGVPVPAMADNTGSYWKRADDSDPISAYKSAGPPGALQATPTEYRNYAADDDISLGGGISANRKREVGDPLEESGKSGENLSTTSGPGLKPDIDVSNRSYDEPVEPHSKYSVSNASVPVASDSDPISAYKSAGPPGALQASPTEYRNYAADDDMTLGRGISTDRKRDVGGPLEKSGRSGENLSATSGPGFKPDIDASNRSYDEPVEPHSKHSVSNVSVPDTNALHPESLASSNLSAEESSAPVYDKIFVMEEDLSADRKLGVGLPSDEHVGSGKGNALESSVPEFLPEGKSLNSPDSESGESHSKHGVLGTGGTSASDVDVPYPGDLIKPNPSFGQSSSPTHGKIAVVNKDAPTDEKLGLGLSTGEHSGSGKGSLLETSVPEGEELGEYQEGGSSLPLEADELVYRPVSDLEEGSSLTSPPGKLEGAVYGRNTDLQGSGTGSLFPDHSTKQSGELSEKDLPTSEVDTIPPRAENDILANYGEQKRSFDVASEQPAGEGIDTTGNGSSENWGKWSTDKINAAKDVTVSSLVASDLKNDGKTQDNSENKSVDASGTTDKIPDKMPESKDVDAAKVSAGEDVRQDSEEEYYDPNEVKDNQFEQGFALGNAEEDALSGTLAGSAIETLQGLKDTVQSSLGYSNQYDSDAGVEDKSSTVEGEERTLSPSSSQQQQKRGFVQGLRQSVASSLGYGKTGPEEEVGQDTERGVEPETDFDSRQQQSGGTEQVEDKARSPSSSQRQQRGGYVQGLKQTVASSLGYGKAGPDEEVGQNTDALERGGNSETDLDSRQQQSDGIEEVKKRAPSPSSSQELQEGGFVQGLKETAVSPLKYGEAGSDKAGHNNDVLEKGELLETDSESSSQLLSPGSSQRQQRGGYVQGLKQTVASSLGYGKAGPDEEGGHNADALEGGGESETDLESRQEQSDGIEEVKKRAPSPSSSQELQKDEFVQGLKGTAASPLEYGEAGFDKAGDNNDVLEKGEVSKTDSESSTQLLSPGSSQRQQRGGFVQGLKQTVASSLGYGKAGPDEEVGHNADALEGGGESETDLESRQEQLDGIEEVKKRAPSPSSSQELQKDESIQGLKGTAASPLEYGEAGSDKAGDNNDVLEKGEVSKTDSGSSTQLLSPGSSQRQQRGGFVQGLKQTVASSLGYGKTGPDEEVGHNTDALEGGGESETDLESRQEQSDGIEEVKKRAPSPSSSQELQKGGFVQGLKETAVSPLEYGEVGSDKAGDDNDVLEKGEVSETDSESRQQQPAGAYQALKNVFASKLGYGAGSEEQSPTMTKESESREFPVEPESLPHDDEGETHESVTKPGLVLNDTKDNVGKVDEVPKPSPRSPGVLQGLKDRVTSTFGYGAGSGEQSPTVSQQTESRDFPAESEKHEVPHDEGETHENATKTGFVLNDAKDNTEKMDEVPEPSPRSRGVLQGLKDSVTSTLGYGAGTGEQSPTMTKKTESDEFPAEQERHEIPHDEGGGETHESFTKPGLVLNDAMNNAGRVDKVPEPSPRSQGVLQGLKNTVTSTFGYGAGSGSGSGEQSPAMSKETESREVPAEPEGRENLHGEEGETHESVTKPGLVFDDAKENAGRVDEVSEPSPRGGGVLQGLKNSVEPEPEPEHEHEPVSSPGADHPPSSYTQKFMGTTAAARNYLFSKVGYGSSREDKAERNIHDVHDGEKLTSPSSHVDNSPNE